MDNQGFEQLEGKVGKLLDLYNGLRKDKAELQGTLQRRDEEIDSLKDELSKMHSERDDLRSRINSLLDMLKEIETS